MASALWLARIETTRPSWRTDSTPSAQRAGSSTLICEYDLEALIVAFMSSSEPETIILPWSMMPMWSAIRSTSASWCDEKKMVVPDEAAMATSSRSMSSMAAGSRPSVGSSRISSSAPRADCQQQHQLRSHALGEIGNLALRRKLEHLQVALFQVVAPFGEERTGEADDLLHGHVGVELLVLGDEADAAADLDGAVGVGDGHAEDLGGAAVGAQQAHQGFDGGGLACAVAAEEAEDASGRDAQIQAAQGRLALERLTELTGFDDEICHGFPSRYSSQSLFRAGLSQFVFKYPADLVFGQPQRERAARWPTAPRPAPCGSGGRVLPPTR